MTIALSVGFHAPDMSLYWAKPNKFRAEAYRSRSTQPTDSPHEFPPGPTSSHELFSEGYWRTPPKILFCLFLFCAKILSKCNKCFSRFVYDVPDNVSVDVGWVSHSCLGLILGETQQLAGYRDLLLPFNPTYHDLSNFY